MDFRLSEEQEHFQQSVAQFATREVLPAAAQIDEAAEFPRTLFAKCAEAGYLGLRYPEALGGSGTDAVTFALMLEQLARGSLSLAAVVMMQGLMGTDFVHRFGTPDHHERLLRPALRGEKIGTIAMTEPDSGSDLGSISTTARPDEGNSGGWVLNGRKMWITSATVADFFTVAAKTDPEAGFKGIDLFLVEKDTPGLSIGRKIEKLGVRASETAEVILDNVCVPAENLLGSLGTGFKNLGEILSEIRVMTGALALGLGQAALDSSLRYSRERTQFGKPIGEFQAVGHKLAEMATQLEAARGLVYRGACLIDQGEPDVKLAAMAKLFASEMANSLADQATRIFGSYGFAMEYDAQRYYRDARFLLYGGGTSEILKNIISRELAGRAAGTNR